VVSAFNETHIAQMLGCLSITNPEVAILPSFKEARLHWKRVIRDRRDWTTDNADNTDEER